jgi:hypothetical protein
MAAHKHLRLILGRLIRGERNIVRSTSATGNRRLIPIVHQHADTVQGNIRNKIYPSAVRGWSGETSCKSTGRRFLISGFMLTSAVCRDSLEPRINHKGHFTAIRRCRNRIAHFFQQAAADLSGALPNRHVIDFESQAPRQFTSARHAQLFVCRGISSGPVEEKKTDLPDAYHRQMSPSRDQHVGVTDGHPRAGDRRPRPSVLWQNLVRLDNVDVLISRWQAGQP